MLQCNQSVSIQRDNPLDNGFGGKQLHSVDEQNWRWFALWSHLHLLIRHLYTADRSKKEARFDKGDIIFGISEPTFNNTDI